MKKVNYQLIAKLLLVIFTFSFNISNAQKNIDCTQLSSLPGCTNYIINNTFTPNANYDPYVQNHYTRPFLLNLIPNWYNTHGTPQIYDGVNGLGYHPEPPFTGAGFAHLFVGFDELFQAVHAEGVAQKIPKLVPNKTYILSFYKRVRTPVAIDNFDIYAMKCSDNGYFNPNSGSYPPLPPNSKKIYCETQVLNTTWQRVIIKFTVEDEYNMLWFYPKQNFPQNPLASSFYISTPQIIEDFIFTAGTNPTAPNSPNCSILIGPAIPNCTALQGAIFTWTSPAGIETIVQNPSVDQRILVNTANSNEVGIWTLTMTFPNTVNTNSNCGSSAFFSATVNVSGCINVSGQPQIMNNGYFSANTGCTPINYSIIPYTNNNFCYMWECGGEFNLESNYSIGNEWFVNGISINPPPAGDGFYDVPGVGQLHITNNTKKIKHSRTSSSATNYLFNVQLKNTLGGYQQLTPPTNIRYVPTFFPNDFLGEYKADYTLNISAYNAGPGSIYNWSITDPNTIVTDIDNTTPEASVYFSPNVSTNGISGTLTVSNSPYCNGIYNVYFTYNPTLFTNNTIERNEKTNSIIYPNPTTYQVTISTINNSLIQSIEIGNLFNPIIKRVIVGNNKSSTINVSTLSPGIYNCKITTNKGVEYQKLIIKR